MTLRVALILCSAVSLSWAASSVPVSTQPPEIITSARSSASAPSYLLFPYTVTQAGFDTEITVANTSRDTFGTPPQSGSCLLTFRGSGTVPVAQTTATIAGGQQLVFKMSEGGGGIAASPNFQGYITAQCSFPLARGIATIFAPTLAFSQAAEVITLPRPTTAPTHLLFQYVTNRPGFDTPIAIANTSGDLDLPQTTGRCTFYFYGSPPHGTVITDPISPGTVYTNVIAFMAPGFEGYVIARCNFMGATGMAFVTDPGAQNLAFSVTPERLPIPRITLPWPTTTRLLFPAVTNQNGLDTPFSLANTTSDPCGTTPTTGNCVLSFFGENAPLLPFVTPTVDPGTVYTNLLSNVAPNFQGYTIAECGGTLGRGWAITLKAGATVDGGEQTPEILPPNWIPRDTTSPYPSLLFTGVTNWRNDLDTKITISNTSRDQYGTPQSHGSCTINYFGDMADGSGTPSQQVSADIQAGQQLSFSLSQGNLAQGIPATPGFRGYIIAGCNFALARGLATVTGIPAGDTYLLTTNVYPPGGGSITPGGWFHAGTVVTINAVANTGYEFDHFSGALSGSTHPQNVPMNAPKNVVANYAALVPKLAANISSKSGPPAARKWGITLTNHPLATANANAAQITGVALTQTFGAACSPPPTITDPSPPPSGANPLVIGNLAPGASGAATVTINFSGCVPTARFKAVISFAANGGSYAGSTTLNNQFR